MGRALGLLAGYSPADLTPSSKDIQTRVTAAEFIKALTTSLPQGEHTDPGSLHHVDGRQSERSPQALSLKKRRTTLSGPGRLGRLRHQT